MIWDKYISKYIINILEKFYIKLFLIKKIVR